MAQRGVTLLICDKEKTIDICPNGEGGWKNSLQFDKSDDRISNYWSTIQKDPSKIKDILISLKNQFIITKIIGFKANGNTVYLKDLYKKDIDYFTVFIKNRTYHSLLVVGCKTSDEIIACGYTKGKESNCPLILSIINKIPAIINGL